jgi:hypothetical protein
MGGQVLPSASFLGVASAPDSAARASRASAHSTPLVLQVSPLHSSSGCDEFYYYPIANIDQGDFAAPVPSLSTTATPLSSMTAPMLWPSKISSLRWSSAIYLSSLPEGLIAEGHEVIATQRRALQQAPPPVTPP